MQVDIPLSGSRQSPIRLIIDPQLEGKEHYQLKVDQKGMTISGASAAAVFYGVMTVDQVIGSFLFQRWERNDSYQYR
ncbi:MAG: glycoside hydrolase family 20 zincin-like fold domain-containing protein [Bacteroides fragilis]